MKQMQRAKSFLSKAGIVVLAGAFVFGFRVFNFLKHPFGDFSVKSRISEKNNLIDRALDINIASADVDAGGDSVGCGCGCSSCGCGGCSCG